MPAIPVTDVIYINCDQDAVIDLFDEYTGAEVDDATVMCKVTDMPEDADEDGTTVIAAVECDYQSNGQYKGVLPATDLTYGALYIKQFNMTEPGGGADERKIGCVARYRGQR